MLGGKLLFGFLKSGEEGAELAQAVIKMMVHSDEFIMENGNQFFEKLVEEFGDIMAATTFVWDNAPANFKKRVNERVALKMDRFEGRFVDNGVE